MNGNFSNKKIKGIKDLLTIIVMLALFVAIILIINLRSSEPIVIDEDRISIYLHQRGPYYIIARLRGGYEVRFDDIAEINLLPYSAAHLSNTIDNLHMPPLRDGASTNQDARRAVARYDDGNHHRIHVSLFPEASPTIWITRYEGVPVLLSFRYGHETEALYEQIVDAWERWQAS